MADNPKLTVMHEKFRGKVFEINKDEMSIGRRDTNDICIKDSSLSGHHADIFRREVDGKTVYVLRDNDSTNGTRINNVPLTGEQVLEPSDLIVFGNVETLFDSKSGVGRTSVTATTTIKLEDLDTNSTTRVMASNFDPTLANEQKKHALTQKVMLGVLGVAGAVFVAIVIYVLVKVLCL